MSTSKKHKLLTRKGYFEKFHENTQKTESYREAWEMTERELFEKYGQERYSSYESFKTVKSQIHKRR